MSGQKYCGGGMTGKGLLVADAEFSKNGLKIKKGVPGMQTGHHPLSDVRRLCFDVHKKLSLAAMFQG